MMATMNRTQRIRFWWRNGFSLMEAVKMSEKEIGRDVIVALKKLRIENEKRKKQQPL